jgi:hypothetical protein
MLVTAVLLVAVIADGPVWLRTMLAVGTFFLAPGLALVGPPPWSAPVLSWSLVIGLSIAVDLLGAMLLLATSMFSVSLFLVVVLLVEAAGIGCHWALGRADQPVLAEARP